jgi:predicted transposase/invertase (TIGR01784 family)
MPKELLSPLYDYVVKIIYGDQKNIANTTALLKAIPVLPAEEFDRLTIVDPFLKRLWKRDKQGILDIKVNTHSGKVVQIEVQVQKFRSMRSRIVYYLSRMLTEQMKTGYDYDRIQQTVSIVICNYVLLPEETAYLNTYELRNTESRKLFTELIKVIILELPKVPKEDDGTAIWPWMHFFKCRKVEEFNMLATKHPEVSGPVAEIKRLSWSERRRMIAEAREKWRRDMAAMKKDAREDGLAEGKAEGIAEGLAEGIAEGKAKGKAEGIAENRMETARKMKQDSLPIGQIVKYTGLNPEEIERI